MKRGFGLIPREHGEKFMGLLQDADGHMDSAERVLRGGDCEAGVESTLAAERLYGEARGHYAYARRDVRQANYEWLARATRRLNFLRQALKRCVRG